MQHLITICRYCRQLVSEPCSIAPRSCSVATLTKTSRKSLKNLPQGTRYQGKKRNPFYFNGRRKRGNTSRLETHTRRHQFSNGCLRTLFAPCLRAQTRNSSGKEKYPSPRCWSLIPEPTFAFIAASAWASGRSSLRSRAERPVSTQLSRSRRVSQTAGVGHEDQFPPPRPNGRCGL